MSTLFSTPNERVSKVVTLKKLKELGWMDADTFCERWFGLDQLSDDQTEKAKNAWGYRAGCVRLLSAVLRKPEKTVGSWGARFEKMPKDLETTLAYADSIRQQIQASHPDLLKLYLEREKKK